MSEASVVVSQMCLSCEMPLHEGDTRKVSPKFQLISKPEQVAGMNKQPPLEQKLVTEAEDLTSSNVRLFVLQCMSLVSSCWASLGWSKAPGSCAKCRCLVERCTSAHAVCTSMGILSCSPCFLSLTFKGWLVDSCCRSATEHAAHSPSPQPFPGMLRREDTVGCVPAQHPRSYAPANLLSLHTVKITSSAPSLPTWGHCTSYLSYSHS